MPTDRHVRTLLSNPLLTYTSSKGPAKGHRKRDPIDHFDEAVAKGLMNPDVAAGILIAKRRFVVADMPSSALHHMDISVHKAMAAEGIGLRVVQWLQSSGLERDLSFLEHKRLISQLLPIMMEEGLEEIAWTWLERWMQRPSPVTPSRVAAAQNLLCGLTLASSTVNKSLDPNYSRAIRADDMFHQSEVYPRAIRLPWRRLTLCSTIFAWQHSQPSEALFNSFVSISAPLVTASDDIEIVVDRAHLDLYHPTHPNATSAMQLLKSPIFEYLARLSQPLKDGDEIPPRSTFDRIHRFLLVASDAAQHFSSIGQVAQAQWIQKVISDRFSNFHQHTKRLQLTGDSLAQLDLPMFQRFSAG